jgi:hypothetical protein
MGLVVIYSSVRVHSTRRINPLQEIIGHNLLIKYSPAYKNKKSDKLAVKDLTVEISQKNPDPNYKVLLSDLIEILTGPEFGFTLLKALQLLHWLVDQEGTLIPIEHCRLVSFLFCRIITSYQERQQQYQSAWLEASETKTLAVFEQERKEFERADILRFEQGEQKQVREKRRKRGFGR